MKTLRSAVPAGWIAGKHAKADRYHLASTPASTEVEVTRVLAALAAVERVDHLLEVGTHTGDTTRAIAKLLDERQTLWTLDTRQTLAPHPRVKALQVDSLAWVPPEGVRFGFVFVDGATDNREADLRRYATFALPGALIAVHDTATPYHGVASVVTGLVHEGVLRTGLWLDTPKGLWIGRAMGGKHGANVRHY